VTFPRVNPGSWATNAKLTSPQANQLDIDHAAALNGSVAGDTLLGVVAMASGSAVLVNGPTAQIISYVAQGITTSGVASGITSGGAGGIALTGGSNDYPTFMNSAGSAPATRSFTRSVPIVTSALSAGWTVSNAGYGLVGPATAQQQVIVLPSLWTGATLSSVSIAIQVGNVHSGVPSNLPHLSVQYQSLTSTSIGAALSTTNPQAFTPTPGSGAAWYDGSNMQQLTYLCNQNNVIATGTVYFIQLVDENGTNSIAGDIYYGITLNYTAVANMAPQ
jgi:hypothetical protein